MKSAFYAGASGLMAHQTALNNIGNNLANVNTNGYQRQGVSFQDLLYMQMYANSEEEPYQGVGVKAVSTGIQTGTNPLKETDYPLDFAIVGDGFFAVRNGNEIQYTRDGEFALSLEGNAAYLSTQSGLPVLDASGNRIALSKKADGSYNYDLVKNQLGVYQFDYPGALEPISGNRYLPTANSGAAVSVAGYERILPGFIETSGVFMVDEMSDMIAAQRAYQLSARVVQTADENEQTINNLRK